MITLQPYGSFCEMPYSEYLGFNAFIWLNKLYTERNQRVDIKCFLLSL